MGQGQGMLTLTLYLSLTLTLILTLTLTLALTRSTNADLGHRVMGLRGVRVNPKPNQLTRCSRAVRLTKCRVRARVRV